MEPIIFHASVKGFSSDDIGQSKLSFAVPDCDKDAAHEVGKLVGEVLIVTVVREKDVQGICEQVQSKGKKLKTKGGAP